jgi:hypothetical protein
MTKKSSTPTHRLPQVPAAGGGTQDRSRDENERFREKRGDTGHHHTKKNGS